MTRNFLEPPPDASLDGLLTYIWTKGIGNLVDENGVFMPWTLSAFLDRAAERGVQISRRSVQNWFTARTRIHPSPTNLVRLSKVIANAETAPAWREALLHAPREVQDGEAAAPAKEIQSAPVAHKEPTGWSRTLQPSRKHAILFGVTAALLGAIGVWRSASGPVVEDVAFCTRANFDFSTNRCRTLQSEFPYGVKRVYLTIDIVGLPEGQPFVRKWFLDARKFMEIETHNAPPWEGWTWIGSEDPFAPNAVPMDPGRYTLNVIIGDHVYDAGFTIGPQPRDG